MKMFRTCLIILSLQLIGCGDKQLLIIPDDSSFVFIPDDGSQRKFEIKKEQHDEILGILNGIKKTIKPDYKYEVRGELQVHYMENMESRQDLHTLVVGRDGCMISDGSEGKFYVIDKAILKILDELISD